MSRFKLGLQLYSVREDMEKDMDSALAQVKAMGYDYVEFAGYFGHTAEEVKAMLDPMLVTATLSATDVTITFTGAVDVLNNEEKKAVGAIFVKKTFKWDGEIFKKVI